jgi:hypothetical protein
MFQQVLSLGLRRLSIKTFSFAGKKKKQQRVSSLYSLVAMIEWILLLDEEFPWKGKHDQSAMGRQLDRPQD